MRKIILLLSLGLVVGLVQAQTSCPANVLLALARAGSACVKVGINEVCYGNGSIQAALHPNMTTATWQQAGDIVPIAAVQTLQLNGGEDWSAAILRLQANLPAVQQRNLTMLLFGQVTLENLVPPIPELTVQAKGALTIRALPLEDAEILQQFSVLREVKANGRTTDNRWLRVLIPDSSQYGWVATQLLKDVGFNVLNVVDETTPIEQPFQRMSLTTAADDALCANAPESGVLLQSPDTVTPILLNLNGMALQVRGTAFVQSVGTDLNFQVLNGQVVVIASGQKQLIPSGAQLTVGIARPMDTPLPYELLPLATLPTTNLPYRFALAQPLLSDEIALALNAFNATPTPAPNPDELVDPTGCAYVVLYTTSVRAGPGKVYEVLRDIAGGRRLYPPNLEARDINGAVWWRLRSSAWIEAKAVEATPECTPVPLVDRVPPPPYNTLIMETCETTNGPLREGQLVTIQFVIPSFETRQEAIDAPNISVGSIVINRRERLYMYYSNIIQLTETAFTRQFSGDWWATAGLNRIIAKRLHYELTCDLTVPHG